MVDPALQTFYENHGTRGEVGVQPFDGADVKDDRVRWERRNLTKGEWTNLIVGWKWWGPPKKHSNGTQVNCPGVNMNPGTLHESGTFNHQPPVNYGSA